MDKEERESSIKWLNSIPLSRHTRNLARDFSDGVLMAELLKYYYPKYVDLHNYSPAFKRASKVDNWSTLNRKVFRKLKFHITDTTIAEIVSCTEEPILNLLTQIRLMVGNEDRGHLNDCSDSRQKTSPPSRTFCTEKKKMEKMDYLALLKKKNQELSEKEEIIKALTQTVLNLEIELQLKNENIKDISSKLSMMNTHLYFSLL
ncbi:hypothetical protein B7P43_G09198 [Cryptotermes secundus]|uniref:Calponin-homology (CH) domain-containing protein n=1 Tax=Cryptotermes secundus TaxID=105785 RepID=A0A2J7QGS5_9NEOP|nr:sperm flagellar protein 1 [Cryptotermes secundus]PNF27786.1 hypothetical protein B7P43_G09198 [Cryptotermes secundus]